MNKVLILVRVSLKTYLLRENILTIVAITIRKVITVIIIIIIIIIATIIKVLIIIIIIKVMIKTKF